MATKTRKYRFDIDTPVSKKIIGIIVETESANFARTDAYTALHSMFGPGCRIKTSAEDAKVMRRLPNNMEAVNTCYRMIDGKKVYWAWLVFAD